MLIRCLTLFDITETGVTGHYKPSHVPFCDRAGTTITNINEWTTSRNKQRNFETILQVLQLRTQIFDTTIPVNSKGKWVFEFNVEFNGIYQLGNDEFGTLKQDCDGVPMIIGLDDEYALSQFLIVNGSQQNIWFETVPVNN